MTDNVKIRFWRFVSDVLCYVAYRPKWSNRNWWIRLYQKAQFRLLDEIDYQYGPSKSFTTFYSIRQRLSKQKGRSAREQLKSMDELGLGLILVDDEWEG